MKCEILPRIKEIEDYKIENDGKMFEVGAHGFRHFIATLVQAKTRNIKATQFVLGHHDEKCLCVTLEVKSRGTPFSTPSLMVTKNKRFQGNII